MLYCVVLCSVVLFLRALVGKAVGGLGFNTGVWLLHSAKVGG
jgi:hypothetical protein